MNEFLGKWLNLDHNSYQQLLADNKKLVINSRELVDLLEDKIQPEDYVFELGCSFGRNLFFLLERIPTIKIGGNDLDRDACLERAREEVRQAISFYERDSLTMMSEAISPDIVIAYDHLMHIDEETVQRILEGVRDRWRPRVIVIRDVNYNEPRRGPTSHMPRIRHDFSCLESSYSRTYFQPSRSERKVYNVSIYERKT